jgi:hypothetical protein
LTPTTKTLKNVLKLFSFRLFCLKSNWDWGILSVKRWSNDSANVCGKGEIGIEVSAESRSISLKWVIWWKTENFGKKRDWGY